MQRARGTVTPRTAALPILGLWLIACLTSCGAGQAQGVALDRPSASPGAVPRANALVGGKPASRGEILLRGDGSSGADLAFWWTQTRGVPAVIKNPSVANAQANLPPGPARLEFMLTVQNAQGLDSATVNVDVPAPGMDTPVADAGDDPRGFAGQAIRLDGSKSAPQGKVGFRWIQVGGPRPVSLQADGTNASFIPPTTGTYQFLLIVASGSAISEPDIVNVQVAPPPPPSIDQVARQGRLAVKGGVDAAEALDATFVSLAERMDLYSTYADVYSEMSRRLDAIIPQDPVLRAQWADRVLVPLTLGLCHDLRTAGLELAGRDGATVTLSAEQKQVLAGLFRGIAAGCRAVRPQR